MQYLPIQDLMFKKIFTSAGHEDLLKGFVNAILGTNFQSVIPMVPYHIDTYTQYQDMEQQLLFRTEADLLATTETGEKVTIEVQIQSHRLFLERTLYYLCKAYMSNYQQHDGENNYKNLKPVYSINITNFDLFPESKKALNIFHLVEQNTQYKMITTQGTPLLTIAYLSLATEVADKNSLVYHWQNYLKFGNIDNVDDKYLKRAKDYLDKQNLTPKERELLDMATKQQSIQWQIQQDRFEDGLKQGELLGRQQGIEQGEATGIEKGIFQVAKNMLAENLDATIIQRTTGLSLEEIEKMKTI